MSKKFTIECNERQIKLIAQALEAHSRSICGQIGEDFNPGIRKELWKDCEKDMGAFFRKRETVDTLMNRVTQVVWNLPKGSSRGIGYDEEADLGYEMYKEILHMFEKRYKSEQKGEYSWNVHTSEPLKLTKEPTINVKENG